MISELGFLFLILVFVLSSLSLIELVVKRNFFPIFSFEQKKLSISIFYLTLSSFICLAYSFMNSDFTLNVISKNSNSQLPYIYKFTGVWGNHEGSILLWLLVMTFFGFFFSEKTQAKDDFKKPSS